MVIGTLLVLSLGLGCGAQRDSSGAIVEEGQMSVFELRVGDCLTDQRIVDSEEDAQLMSTVAVPCTDPHLQEVYFASDYKATAFPGTDTLIEYAYEVCEKAFPAYVGTPYMDSSLDFQIMYPTQESWSNGDQEVLCLLVPMEVGAEMVGSKKNSGI